MTESGACKALGLDTLNSKRWQRPTSPHLVNTAVMLVGVQRRKTAAKEKTGRLSAGDEAAEPLI